MLRFSKITAASMTAGAFALALLPTANASVMELGVSATSNSTNWLTNGLGQIGTTQEAVDWNVAGDITGFSFLTPPTTTTVNQSYLTGSPSNPSLQFFASASSLSTTSANFGVSDNLGWGSSSTITSLLGTNDLLISEVAPAAGTYYLSIGSSSSGNSDANPITATSLGQVIQWRVSNPSASDVYWFNATNTLATASNGVPSDGVGPIGFSAVAVPEPTSLALVIGSAAGLLLIGRRKELRSR